MDHLPFHPLWQCHWCNQRDWVCFLGKYHTFFFFLAFFHCRKGRCQRNPPTHMSLIKHNAIILFCCGTLERAATMLFMLHGTYEKRKGSLWEFLIAWAKVFCHHNGIQCWKSENDHFFLRSEQNRWELYREISSVKPCIYWLYMHHLTLPTGSWSLAQKLNKYVCAC